VWNSFPHTGAAIGSSPAIASNGVVYVGSDDGYVYAFSTATGQPLWQKSTGGAISSSPAIGSDSALWVASQSGVVYRIWQSGLSPSLTPTSTSTSTPNNTPTPTPTSVPTSTATPTLMPTDTPTPTPTSVATASISLSPSTVTAGAPTTISVTGAGFAPGETVWVGYTAILNGGGTASEQTTATARGDGTFLANALAVPGDIYPAPHQIKALGQSSGRTATAVLNVRAASPAGTPTPTLTPTPTSTAAPSQAPAVIHLRAVRIQLSNRPNWNAHALSLSRIGVGKRVTLAIYVDVKRLADNARLSYTWLLTQNSRRVAHHGKHIALPAGRTGRYWSHWEHAFARPGTYVFTGTASLQGAKVSRNLRFSVYR